MLSRATRTLGAPFLRPELRTLPAVVFAPRRWQSTVPASDDDESGLNSFRMRPPMNTVIHFVPQQMNYVIERLGRFHRVAEPGLQIVVPFVERIAYVHTLKELAIHVRPQLAITKDNVQIQLDGMLFVQICDVYRASYNIQDPLYAISQLAQTTMRSEIGKLSLDQTFEERQMLNQSIVDAIEKASTKWGIHCLRYEIKNITPPQSIQHAMTMQAQAEREKRQEILSSEGRRQAAINEAEGSKQSVILHSEGDMLQRVNEARGRAEAIVIEAEATARAIELVTNAINKPGGQGAVNLKLGEAYIKQFGNLAKTNNTMIIPQSLSDVAGFIASASTVFDRVKMNSSLCHAVDPASTTTSQDASESSDASLFGASSTADANGAGDSANPHSTN